MSVSRTVSEIDGDFSRKAQNIPISRVFAPQLKGLGTAYWRSAWKTRKMGQPCREKSLTISLAVWIQCTNMTDGWRDTWRQQRPRLRIASRD